MRHAMMVKEKAFNSSNGRAAATITLCRAYRKWIFDYEEDPRLGFDYQLMAYTHSRDYGVIY